MKKCITLLAALLLAVPLGGCVESAVLAEPVTYEIRSEIRSLDIQVGAADLTIVPAETVYVESNLKYLSVKEENGVLSIVDEKTLGVTYDGPVLTLYMPEDQEFESVSISTGAGKLTADSLTAQTLKLKLGAAEVHIASLNATVYADVEGGAGKITVDGGTINHLELEMGVGELDLTAALLGKSDLTFGVGSSRVTLLGSREDYRIEIEKGLGIIAVEGIPVSDFETTGTGENIVRIEGGVGAVDLRFA